MRTSSFPLCWSLAACAAACTLTALPAQAAVDPENVPSLRTAIKKGAFKLSKALEAGNILEATQCCSAVETLIAQHNALVDAGHAIEDEPEEAPVAPAAAPTPSSSSGSSWRPKSLPKKKLSLDDLVDPNLFKELPRKEVKKQSQPQSSNVTLRRIFSIDPGLCINLDMGSGFNLGIRAGYSYAEVEAKSSENLKNTQAMQGMFGGASVGKSFGAWGISCDYTFFSYGKKTFQLDTEKITQDLTIHGLGLKVRWSF